MISQRPLHHWGLGDRSQRFLQVRIDGRLVVQGIVPGSTNQPDAHYTSCDRDTDNLIRCKTTVLVRRHQGSAESAEQFGVVDGAEAGCGVPADDSVEALGAANGRADIATRGTRVASCEQ